MAVVTIDVPLKPFLDISRIFTSAAATNGLLDIAAVVYSFHDATKEPLATMLWADLSPTELPDATAGYKRNVQNLKDAFTLDVGETSDNLTLATPSTVYIDTSITARWLVGRAYFGTSHALNDTLIFWGDMTSEAWTKRGNFTINLPSNRVLIQGILTSTDSGLWTKPFRQEHTIFLGNPKLSTANYYLCAFKTGHGIVYEATYSRGQHAEFNDSSYSPIQCTVNLRTDNSKTRNQVYIASPTTFTFSSLTGKAECVALVRSTDACQTGKFIEYWTFTGIDLNKDDLLIDFPDAGDVKLIYDVQFAG